MTHENFSQQNLVPLVPQDPDAEESVLGAILISPKALVECSEILTGDEFYRDSHSVIYRGALALWSEGVSVDPVTLADRLRRDRTLGDIGETRLHELALLSTSASNAPHYAKIVRETHLRREASAILRQAEADLTSGGEILEQLEAYEDQLMRLRSRVDLTARKRVVSAQQLAQNARDALEAGPEDVPTYGNPWGIPLEFRGGRLYTLGGHTGHGKSALALQLFRHLCGENVRVGYISLEMSEEDLRNRLIAQTGIPLSLCEHPERMTSDRKESYVDTVGEIERWNMDIVDDERANVGSIRRRQRTGGYAFLMVDHIHRIDWGEERRHLEREIVNLTSLAREYDIPVLMLAQLRRSQWGKVERPGLSDFRESGVIEQESALAFAVFRKPEGTDGESDLIVLKNRHGPTGSYQLQFDGETMTFRRPHIPGVFGA